MRVSVPRKRARGFREATDYTDDFRLASGVALEQTFTLELSLEAQAAP